MKSLIPVVVAMLLFAMLLGNVIGWHYGAESARHEISMSCVTNGSFERRFSPMVGGGSFVFSCKQESK